MVTAGDKEQIDRDNGVCPPGAGRLADEKVDVAISIFAKPFQTALTLLSLLQHSGRHISGIWLQFEPAGSRYDQISPYFVASWLQERADAEIIVFQPKIWTGNDAIELEKIADQDYRHSIRYQYAFENSKADKLFLLHNDVLFLRDIIGDMLLAMGDAFAIGDLGQCWNCPASVEDLTREVMGCPACTSQTYSSFRPDYGQLQKLYSLAEQKQLFKRYYTEGIADFAGQPWPMPECRVNEWACLIDLASTRSFCLPYGSDYPPGGYRKCGNLTLDLGVAWFRAMHGRGLGARHFACASYIKHFVGTGNKSRTRYCQAEERALALLRRLHPEYLQWLSGKTGMNFA